MKTLKNVALTVLTLIPLAELLFLPIYLAQRTSVDLNQFTAAYQLCIEDDSACPIPVEPPQ